MKKLFAILLLATTLISCAGLNHNIGNQELFDDAKLAQLQKGATTRKEIIQMFGNPHNGEQVVGNWDNDEQEILMMYYGSQMKTSPATLVPVVGQIIIWNKENNGTAIEERTLNITLNMNKVLKDYDYIKKNK